MPMAMNRALSIRSSRRDRENTGGRHRFSISTFRGIQAPELSRRLSRLIKSENNAIGAYEAAGRERSSIAAQLSDWGESTEDDAVSDISDKLGVMLAEIGEQEDVYAQNLEDSRGVLKHIRNMEASVQPSREQRQKVTDEIAKLKYKDPNSTRITTLEHELVRAEAQNLVAEAQLSNTTRTKLKEAYDIQLAATIERAEKQIILARHARRLLNYIDDSPLVPGDARAGYEHEVEARQVLEDAEADLRAWESTVEPVTSAARGASVSEQGEGASLINGGDSMVNDVPPAAKQMEEPQSAKAEAEPVPY
ncbi:Sphingolipid long chain base-responsive protein LSP1 [Penicillium cosmopolitanum]|uniref:Sphingolipid long chain base-responsive protein LSP1 n=1 Tax=Penicillium cosmopolitanum TaxID=1131564 RepID=A0A9X0BEF1_9EURO|nr:Sphingolipid long chain base-responsive protein LSP1 [Penicillium cosmopolitanum]KAJ5414182.1 Sphingolipid long chain base-responsive protein LSP1 [Penicillium cosmopolitanum]